MKALVFSDLHADFKMLKNIRNYIVENDDIGLIIFAGDFVNMGEPVGFTNTFIEDISATNKPFFWVPGNNDFGRSYYLLKKSFPTLEGKIIEFENRRFTGVGGSPASWAGQYAGEAMIEEKSIVGSIFVSHVPPPGAHNYQHHDCYAPTSKKLSSSPLIHICGHDHYRFGCAYLGSTKIVKLAPAERGFYAIMDLNNLAVEFKRFN